MSRPLTHARAGRPRGAVAAAVRACAALLGVAAAALLAACASGPAAPAWQGDAKSAIDAAVESALQGDARAEALAYARARDQVGRTGDPALLARLALMRCAARVAALDLGPCTDYDALHADAAPPERAYAAHLAGRPLARDDIARLPAAQQGAATAIAAGTDPAPAVLQGIEDPLSRLVAAAALFQAGRASPQLIAVAADTASAQGWRRPLLAWLGVQVGLAERAGDAAEAARLKRRVQAATPASAAARAPAAPASAAPAASAPAPERVTPTTTTPR